MRQTIVNLYTFDELDDRAKGIAVQNNRYINIIDDWWEPAYDWFKKEAAEYGIKVKDENIYFSVSGCQGDGASFTTKDIDTVTFIKKTGTKVPMLEKFKDCYTKDIPMAVLRIDNHYCHENTVQEYINVDYSRALRIAELLEHELRLVKNDLCGRLYERLRAEYDYLTSDEAIKETLLCNEYEFYDDGKISG